MRHPERDVLGRLWKPSNRTISTMIPMQIWWCRRKSPSFRTIWTPRRTRKAKNPRMPNTSRQNIEKHLRSSWRRIKPSGRILQTTEVPRRLHRDSPIGIFVLFVGFLPTTPAPPAARDTAAWDAWGHIKTPDVSNGQPRELLIRPWLHFSAPNKKYSTFKTFAFDMLPAGTFAQLPGGIT